MIANVSARFLLAIILFLSLLGSSTILPTMATGSSLEFTSSNSTSIPNAPDSTITTVTPNHATFISGDVVFTASVVDASNPSSSMIGIITWSDSGAGGIFNSDNKHA